VLRFVAHDGPEGISPDGWLSDRISVGVLTSVFMPELVDVAVDKAGARGQRRRLLQARLVVYFTSTLWLFWDRNCGYGQVMTKLADGPNWWLRAKLVAAMAIKPARQIRQLASRPCPSHPGAVTVVFMVAIPDANQNYPLSGRYWSFSSMRLISRSRRGQEHVRARATPLGMYVSECPRGS
jgi:hypothetical protein